MIIEVSSEIEARLEEIAQHEGKSVSSLVIDTVLSLHRNDEHFRNGVEQGLAQANAGEFVDDAEMQALWNRLLRRA